MHVCVRVCVRGSTCGHVYVCVSVEQAWPRLIATSYLVVTGLIKDDELTVGLSLPYSLSLAPLSFSCPSFGRKMDRQPPVPHYGLFLERRGGWEDDGKREREREGERTRLFISALSSKGDGMGAEIGQSARGVEAHRLQHNRPIHLLSNSEEAKNDWMNE